MKRVEIKFRLSAVEPLLEVIRSAADSLRGKLGVAPVMPDLEPEFRGAWTDELLTSQNEDVQALLGLFDETFQTSGVIGFDEDNAENVVRACSSVRLQLRSGVLAGIDDDRLEGGDVDLNHLKEPTRKAFKAYLLLATIQELVIQHMDSTILGS